MHACRSTLEDPTDDVGRFADALGLDRFDLAGISMGGLNAIGFAGAHPERVRRLIVVDAGPVLGGAGVGRVAKTWDAQTPVFDSPEDAVAEAAASWPKEPPLDDAAQVALRRRTVENLRLRDDGKWVYKCDRTPPSDQSAPTESISEERMASLVQAGHQLAEERWQCWRSIQAPTLLVRGAVSDIFLPETAEQMIAEQPNARLVTIEGSGHSVTVYKGRELGTEMRSFLLAR